MEVVVKAEGRIVEVFFTMPSWKLNGWVDKNYDDTFNDGEV